MKRRRRGWRLTWQHTHIHTCLLHTFFHRPPASPSLNAIQIFHGRDEHFSQNVKIGLNTSEEKKQAKESTHAHVGGPSCLCVADTNKGCWGFDSARQAATAQQARPFTACQPALLQEASTKSRWMWDSHKRDDGDTVTSNLKHAGTHKKDRQTPPHTHTNSSLSSTLILLPPCRGDSSWPVRLSVTLMNLLSYVQIMSSYSPESLFLYSFFI